MQQFLVILRGVTASGKSTIAKRFRNFEQNVVWLKVDNYKDFFAEDSSKALEFVDGSALATLKYLLDAGFSVVMESVFRNTATIDESVELAKSKGVKSAVYQISCSLAELLVRDTTRAGIQEGCREPLGSEVITRIYEHLESNPYPNALRLDTEHMAIDQCVEQIKRDITSQ
ncbi:zeta toxin family protein [Candidatus Woesebacteria bacterium]|nr:zeta toxin family protein [Candidatus Woesebacteria bacterium]